MFQDYYKSKAQAYSKEMEKFNSKYLSKLDDFEDAVKKYKKFQHLYYQTAKYVNKLAYGHIDSEQSMFNQIKRNMDGLYNSLVINALKKKNETEALAELNNIKEDLNRSYGYGFDSYISQYEKDLERVIGKYSVIYKNYRNKQENMKETNFEDKDPLYKEVIDFCNETGKVSASLLQRRFRLGYNRAARIVDLLEEDGIIGPQIGSRPRDVLIEANGTGSVPKNLIDFVDKYGTDYEKIAQEKMEKEKQEELDRRTFIDNYNDNAQKYFDEHGLDIKYNSNSRLDLSKLNNLLFTNSEPYDANTLINKILESSAPNEVKLLLIDYSQINLFEYNGLSNLLLPVVSDPGKAKTSMSMMVSEMNRRYNVFLENGVKNIATYNNKQDVYSLMSYIVIVVNELFEMIKYENTRDILSELLLNCKNAGIIVMGFSKFNKKNIQLFMLEDLFDVHNGYSNNYIECEKENSDSYIDNVDNDMDGFDFEKYAGKLLKSNGFKKVEVTQCSNDFGVDIIAFKDDIKYAIQCKKYSSPVGIKAIQEVIGSKAMNDCHVGVVLTNNTFTKSAVELANKNNILLWDRKKLLELMENIDS